MSTDGFVARRSRHGFDETVARLTAMLAARGVTLFAVIDHAGEAAKVGLAMRPTKVLVFGNPKGGTPLMLASPSIAIDLPLKLLVWEAEDRSAWMAWNAPEYLAQRHGLPAGQAAPLAAVEALAAALSQA